MAGLCSGNVRGENWMQNLFMMKFGRDIILGFITVIVSSSLLINVNGFSTGPPESRCESMIPGHWVSEQSIPSPFEIKLSKTTLEEGEGLSINLTSLNGQEGFKGFLIQAKRPGGGKGNGVNFGAFDLLHSDGVQSQPINCFGRLNSAMGHRKSNEKHSINLVWIAPELKDEEGNDFEMRVTFVQNFWTIWPNLASEKVFVTRKKKSAKEAAVHANSTIASLALLEKPQTGSHLLHHVKVDNASTLPSHKEEHGLPIKSKPVGEIDNAIVSTPHSKLSGDHSWNYFKSTWMNVLHYFGL